MLFAAAALHPSMAGLANPGHKVEGPLSRRRFFLLMSAAFTGPVAGVLFHVEPAWLTHAVTALLVILVAARLAGPVASMSRSSWRDDLTGTGNRSMFEKGLTRALAARGRQDTGVLVVVCDLDHFKVINDSLGHPAGDAVLVAVGQRLEGAVRAGDTVARLDRDHFAILLEGCDVAAATGVIERIANAVIQPVMVAEHRVVPAISIGVAVACPASTSEKLLRDADTALNRAKELGRGRVEWFDDSLHAAAMERLELEGELRHALETGVLRCDYQPEMDIATGMLFGLEALARWEHPVRGAIPPDRFIPIAEATGQVDVLFRQVLDMTLRAQARWAAELGFHPSVAVNLSPVQLSDRRLATTVSDALRRWDAPADSLWIEVTESAAAAGGDLSILDELKTVGVKLAIDDFGTGMSTLARVGEVEWDLLKIDRSFVSRLTTDPQTVHLVRAMVAMAHAMGMLTVAEGVETQEQLDCLRSVGCDIAQGYLLARPTYASNAIAGVSVDGSFQRPPTVLS